MATDSPLLNKVRVLAAKAETTTGTAEALTATEAAFNVMNPVLTPDQQTNERELQAALGQLASVPGADSATLTFDIELSGNGASGLPLWATTFLPACDMANDSGTFSFTRGSTTLTIALYEDGLKRVLFGARGTFTINATVGKPAIVSFTFKGKYSSESDVSILAPTFPTVIPPIVKGTTLTFASFTPRISALTIDAANNVVLREDVTDATGYHAAAITGRKPTGTVDPEQTLVATRDWEGIRDASTEEAFSFAIGSATNNTITIASSACQTVKTVRGNRDDVMTKNVTLQFNSSSPFTLAFS